MLQEWDHHELAKAQIRIASAIQTDYTGPHWSETIDCSSVYLAGPAESSKTRISGMHSDWDACTTELLV